MQHLSAYLTKTYKRPMNSTAPQKRLTRKDSRHGDCILLSQTWPGGKKSGVAQQENKINVK